ncbi:tetratricopeptide repeat protein [Microbaculum sp. FT89]|uniref:tetratricopeptide repeat protein n=1 Tax=Microbaculum sp. FT89 TaxID=3447298 RepID=UPI003F53AC63
MERILSSPDLQASDRRRAFLRYVVEETLAGRADRLKGFTVALAVFGRDETFDSQTDPVVRLEARRLRRDLDSYYVDAGSDDPVRISIPKGSYVPHFEWHDPALAAKAPSAEREARTKLPGSGEAPGISEEIAATGRMRPRVLLITAIVFAILAAAMAGWLLMKRMSGVEPTASADTVNQPAVVVLPFEALGVSETNHYLATGISQELIGDLMLFPGFRIYTFPASQEKDIRAAGPTELGRDLGVAYVVSGSVRAEAEEVRVATQLIDAASGQVLWARAYERPLEPDALIQVQRDLSAEIATELGQPYGVVNSEMNVRLTTPQVSDMHSYVCVLRAYTFRRNFSSADFAPVLQCLEEAVRRDPDYSDAWAMLGWVLVDSGRIGIRGEDKRQEEYDRALQAVTRAVTLAPNSPLALKALAAVNHYIGRYDESERLARIAADLNPYDPEALAQLGWRLAVRGKFEEGIPILKRAIERSANPPGWYFVLIAIDLYLRGDFEPMLSVAERSAPDGRGVSQALIAIAAGELGNQDLARQALAKMAEYESISSDPASYFRRHGATDEITDALETGLEKARRIAAGA